MVDRNGELLAEQLLAWPTVERARLANTRKHGVSFGEARTVFEDDEALIISARNADRGERADYASRRAE